MNKILVDFSIPPQPFQSNTVTFELPGVDPLTYQSQVYGKDSNEINQASGVAQIHVDPQIWQEEEPARLTLCQVIKAEPTSLSIQLGNKGPTQGFKPLGDGCYDFGEIKKSDFPIKIVSEFPYGDKILKNTYQFPYT